MQKLKLDFDSIEGIIDATFENEECSTFICDGFIAQFIRDYIVDTHYMSVKKIYSVGISKNEDYIVTIQYVNELGDEYFEITIEYLTDDNGDYKEVKNVGICYDLSDIDKNIIFDIVDVDQLEFCEFVDNEEDESECDEDCDCEGCKFMNYAYEQFANAPNIISDEDACDKCKFDAISEIFKLGVIAHAEGFVRLDDEE